MSRVDDDGEHQSSNRVRLSPEAIFRLPRTYLVVYGYAIVLCNKSLPVTPQIFSSKGGQPMPWATIHYHADMHLL